MALSVSPPASCVVVAGRDRLARGRAEAVLVGRLDVGGRNPSPKALGLRFGLWVGMGGLAGGRGWTGAGLEGAVAWLEARRRGGDRVWVWAVLRDASNWQSVASMR